MAWLLNSQPEGFAVVPADVDPPTMERQLGLDWFNERGLRYQGSAGATGVEIPESVWPKRARLKTARKALPHITNFASFRALSETAKEVVETIEPGVHDFRPIDVIQKDGAPYSESYYLFNCRNKFEDLVIWNETTAYSKQFGDFRKFRQPYPREQVVIDGVKVRNAHWWLTSEMIGIGHTVSDDLFSRLEQRKLLRGIDPFRLIEKL